MAADEAGAAGDGDPHGSSIAGGSGADGECGHLPTSSDEPTSGNRPMMAADVVTDDEGGRRCEQDEPTEGAAAVVGR